MKVAVLGAAGTIAPAIVRDVADSEEVESILLLDLRGDVAAQVAAAQGLGKAEARQADARSGLERELEGIDALVNSASYRINLEAMRAALAAGAHYLDLGGLYHVTGEQLGLDREFRDAGLLAVLGIGSSPGKTNLMGSRVVEELGETPREMTVLAAGRDLKPPDGLALPYALETLLDELTLPPVVLRDGQPEEVEPLSDGGHHDFGDPIGAGDTIHTLHSELRTFGESFGCAACSFRLSLPPTALDALRRLASASPDEVRAAAERAVPQSPETVSVHAVEALGERRHASIRCLTPPHREWGLGGGIVSTASPAAAAVRLLARGEVTARGALPPERCLPPEQMFDELRTRGCEFSVEVEERVAA
ncbi:MAG TPA: saccharopine dehydrogenase NADP-binding domain-containing protein [Solirubrobacterales bacterium]|nr:saccharopine dehydrogenase NADP-binding domain-containing protein [Solirubrobacterales bacterium]